MSLDIVMLGASGAPNKQTSLGVDDHYRLMQIVGQNNGLLSRLYDYYADTEFGYAELDKLIQEATEVCLICRDDKRLVVFLDVLVELARLAKLEKRPLLAIAD